MPDTLKIAAVQFEMAENDKAANLTVMSRFIDRAAAEGCDLIAFPELCTTGYHFLTTLGRDQILPIAEDIHDGPTVRRLHERARAANISILTGMLERDGDQLFNSYLVITPEDGAIFRHRKLHAFENSAIAQGDEIETFELMGWTMGVLICYDNNLPESNRVLALKGAEVIFAPHQTGGFDIERAGMGRIDPALWHNRHLDPVPMRQAILGPKGYAWITKWLPARSYDNNVYTVFPNGVGIDGPEVRVGCSMIIDPEGIIIAETTDAADAMITAHLNKNARRDSLPASHLAARRPSLYGKITEPVEERSTREVRNLVSGETIV
ncbi:MAG: nitrilase-related carbon-nitrogen hydrolase [bacterium]